MEKLNLPSDRSTKPVKKKCDECGEKVTVVRAKKKCPVCGSGKLESIYAGSTVNERGGEK